jgi:hypothetical protein
MGLAFLSNPSTQPALAGVFLDQKDSEVAFTADVPSGVINVVGVHRDGEGI